LVVTVQTRLNVHGFNVGKPDGIFGPKTKAAVENFQRAKGLVADAVVGPKTWAALNAAPSSGAHIVARLSHQPEGPGRTTGSITVNGRAYPFNSGSSRAYSTPKGMYQVRGYRVRTKKGFVLNGIGFSFIIEDVNRPNSDKMYDARAKRDRRFLRIHPDGNLPGTAGCIGIVGSAAELIRLRDDLKAEVNRPGVCKLQVL
jgi:hypothetical protein